MDNVYSRWYLLYCPGANKYYPSVGNAVFLTNADWRGGHYGTRTADQMHRKHKIRLGCVGLPTPAQKFLWTDLQAVFFALVRDFYGWDCAGRLAAVLVLRGGKAQIQSCMKKCNFSPFFD